MLPFPFMGWVECVAHTAWDWQFSGLLNNVHTSPVVDLSGLLHHGDDVEVQIPPLISRSP